MRFVSRAAGLALFAVFAVHAAEAQAQATPVQGTFAYVEEGSDNVAAAINQAVARMNFVTRPVARGRLTKTNQPYRTVVITQNGGEVSVATDGRPAIVNRANGPAVKWTREDGEVFDVSTAVTGSRVEQTFKADDGQRVNTFTLSPDGQTMTMRVTITSPRLAEPLVYSLRYRRTN
jgi:hypothetical protein